MIYKFKERTSFRVAAQVAAEELERIREQNDGDLTPAAVVEESRPERSPLHPAFEWDDAIAAEKHREDQARSLIRSVRIVEEGDEGPISTIAYVSVGSSVKNGARYVTTAHALADADLRQRVLHDALVGLRSWRARYGHLKELATMVAVIDDIEQLAT